MKSLFGAFQLFGVIGVFVGVGWFVGMIVAFQNETVTVWTVILPFLISLLLMMLGYGMEWIYDKGIASTIEESE